MNVFRSFGHFNDLVTYLGVLSKESTHLLRPSAEILLVGLRVAKRRSSRSEAHLHVAPGLLGCDVWLIQCEGIDLFSDLVKAKMKKVKEQIPLFFMCWVVTYSSPLYYLLEHFMADRRQNLLVHD